MAWKETSVKEQREEFIADWLKKEWNVRELYRRYGIAPKTGYKWMKRFVEEGKPGLGDQRRARSEQAHRTSLEVEERVVELRLSKPHWGPKKLKRLLEDRDRATNWPAESTIGEILKRHNLVKARKRRERGHPSSAPLGHVQEVNQVWCTDFKGWYRCGDGESCYPLTISDAQSRYLLCLEALPQTGHRWLRPHYEEVFRQYGMPEAMRHDNGPSFVTRVLGGLGAQAVWLLELGIRIERIRPGKPCQDVQTSSSGFIVSRPSVKPFASI
ncbi:MAG: transposase [Acidobacteria bacterium]|nr:transposase [Acidobacteriota bacterium]